MHDGLGRWQPLDPRRVAAIFDGAPFRWWLSGGYALELHLGTTWRAHDDVDVGIVRADAAAVAHRLAGWHLSLAAAGRLSAWHGEPLDSALHHNNVWCRREADGPWLIDLAVGEGDAELWRYRRDPRITRPWDEAVLWSDDGLPYLAPELQLLFKSEARRPKDEVDARFVIPRLTASRREALSALLPDGHPWRSAGD